MSKEPRRARRRPRLVTVIVGTLVVAVCAIVPWFIPWPQATSESGAEPPVAPAPASVPEQSSPTATTPEEPTAEDVKDLAKEVEKTAKGGYDLPVDPSEVSSVKTRPGPYQKLGRIQIPAIGLDVSYGEGVFEKTLEKGPGHWPGTPMPGRLGNAVISGHRNTNTQPFKELDRLNPGDKIIVEDQQGTATTFRITGTTIVPEAEYKDFVLGQPEDKGSREITLFACHPEGNPIFRIVVKATA